MLCFPTAGSRPRKGLSCEPGLDDQQGRAARLCTGFGDHVVRDEMNIVVMLLDDEIHGRSEA
jgi:hypothetical protein